MQEKNASLSLYRVYFIVFILITMTLAVYAQVVNHPFISYDDPPYITENPVVRAGLTKEGIIWAFTSTHEANWHPLTWVSHMADVEIFGLSPGGHHFVNVLFHVVNTVLLFLVLNRMTGGVWQSGFVAALFAVHPLHVESVAWIAERKDVLSTFFWFLAIWAYSEYARNRGARWYFFVILFFVMGLLSKPMVVTLPFGLLLLDYWPLGRWEGLSSLPRLVREKVPLLALALISCVVTYAAQQSGGAVAPVEGLPFDIRIANGMVSYFEYLVKMVWPAGLSVFYPYQAQSSGMPIWKAAGAVTAIGVVTALSLRWARRYPFLPVGWFWYLGTLVPVIGLVQVGGQSMADRYTYVPLIGIFILIAWGIPVMLGKLRMSRYYLAVLGGSALFILSVTSWNQTTYWKSNIVLFKHALSVTRNNWLASNHLGLALLKEGKIEDGIKQLEETLEFVSRFSPTYTMTRNNLGYALLQQNRLDEAIGHFRAVIWIDPYYMPARYNLALALRLKGHISEAADEYNEILRINPDEKEAAARLNELRTN